MFDGSEIIKCCLNASFSKSKVERLEEAGRWVLFLFFVFLRVPVCSFVFKVQRWKVTPYVPLREAEVCYHRFEIVVLWTPDGEAGKPGEQGLGAQLSGAFRFHRGRLSRRWLVKFEQRTGK